VAVIYDPVYGVLNHFLGALGVPPLKWLQSLDLVRPSLAAVNVWARLGFDTMIFPGRAPGHPRGVLRGGRHRRRQRVAGLWRITLPLLNPQIVMVAILEADLQLQDLRHGVRDDAGRPRAPARR